MDHKIVLISGKQGSGKSTLADGLEKVAQAHGYMPYRTRFAKVLYEMHDAVCAVAKKYGIPVKEPKEGELLQWIGTEWGRNTKGENVWVDALKSDIAGRIALANTDDAAYGGWPPEKLCIIIDDMRFPNELYAFNRPEFNVTKVRLEATKEARKARCSYWRENDQHPSEIALDEYVMREDGFDKLIRTDSMSAQETLDWTTKGVFSP